MANIPLAEIPGIGDLASMSRPQVNDVSIPKVDFGSERAAVASAYRNAEQNPNNAGLVGKAIAGVGDQVTKVADSYMKKQQELDTGVAKIDLQSKVAEFDNNFWSTADHNNYQTYGNQYLKSFDDNITSWVKSQPQAVQQGIWLDYLNARGKGFVNASNEAHKQDLANKFVSSWDGIQQQAQRGEYENAYAAAEDAASKGLFSPKQKEEAFASIEAKKTSNYANFKIQSNPDAAAEEFKRAAETGSAIPGMESLTTKEKDNYAKIAENIVKYRETDKGRGVYDMIDKGEIQTVAQLEKTQSYQALTPEWKEAVKNKLTNEVLADTPEGIRAVGDAYGMVAKFALGKAPNMNLDYEKLSRLAGTLPAADAKKFLALTKEIYEEKRKGKGDLPDEIKARYAMSAKLYDWYTSGVFGSPDSMDALRQLKQAEADWQTISSRNQGPLQEAEKSFLMQYRKEAASAIMMKGPEKPGVIQSIFDWMKGGKEQGSKPQASIGQGFLPIGDKSWSVTSYGYPGDTTPDKNSSAGIGAFTRHLTRDSFGTSYDVEEKLRKAGVKPGDKVDFKLSNGQVVTKIWHDRGATPEQARKMGLRNYYGRVDLYSPDSPHELAKQGVKVVGFKPYTENGQG